MKGLRCLPVVGLFALSVTLAQTGETVPEAPPSLERCDILVSGAPKKLPNYLCYYDWAALTNRWEDAREHLESLLRERPEDSGLSVALGANRAAQGDLDGMLESYRSARDGFLANSDPGGEAAARKGLADYYVRVNRFDDAEREYSLAESAAGTAGDELLLVSLEVGQGWLAYTRNDLSRASTKLQMAKTRFQKASSASPQTRRQLRLESRIENAFGALYWALREPHKAVAAYRREVRLLERLGDAYNSTTPLFNLALVAASNRRALGLTPIEVRRSAEDALQAALRVGHRKNEMSCRLLLGNLIAGAIERSGGSDYTPAIKHVERVMALSRQLQDEPTSNRALQTLAHLYLSQRPGHLQRSLQLFDAALASAVSRQSLSEIAYTHYYRFEILRANGRPEAALSEGLKTLDAIERIRDLQSESASRVKIFAAWSERYRDVYLFLAAANGRPASRESLDLAVSVIERMRARELLDGIDRASATNQLIAAGGSADRRSKALETISLLQSRLLTEPLSGLQRQGMIRQIEDAELELRRAEEALGRENQKYKLLRAPNFASLADVQEVLGTDEAVLSYQLLVKTGNLMRITKDSVETFIVPNRYELRNPVEFLASVITRRDESESSGAVRLYRNLVGDALDGLPATVGRLIVVPDGGLEKLPFGALRRDLSGPRLAEKYEIVLTPSLTAWLGWRKAGGKTPGGRLLALADPILPLQQTSAAPASARTWSLAARFSLGTLPHARDEGRAAIRSLGGQGRLVFGREASEFFLKEVDLSEFGVLHFAAHALVDEENPDRAALLLAPGSETEDGLLQVREIVNLNLAGQLVILSACQSASGEVLSGEGVLSLARAFFVAGAHTVVGSLWPLRDEDAAVFFGRFYEHLGAGASASEALAAAQRDRITEGAPAAAWAGMVVVGNGDLTPFPEGVPRSPRHWAWWLLTAAALLAAGFAARGRLNRPRGWSQSG